ncbi:hypothetical protein [Mycobacterium paraintracellulare]|nr:hypothetical protein [Mycobacterium paraintracellulare]
MAKEAALAATLANIIKTMPLDDETRVRTGRLMKRRGGSGP